MPIYQYRGISCDHEFEVHQSFSDDPLTTCPECGKPVRRVIHAAPIVFKGSGWYLTDSRPTTEPVGGVQDAKKHETAKEETKPDTAAKSTPAEAKSSAVTAKAE